MNSLSELFALLPGFCAFITTISAASILWAATRYVLSGGDQGAITAAKNTLLYGIISFVPMGVTWVVSWLTIRPDFGEFAAGFLLGGAATVSGALVLTGKYVSKGVAAYSAWWMPKAERIEHRQDILHALTRTSWGSRSRHAWGLLKSSPRAGLRARQFHARLAAVKTSKAGR